MIVAILIGSGNKQKSIHYDKLIDIFADEVKKIFQTTTKLFGLPLQLCYRLNLKIWRDFKECVDNSMLLGKILFINKYNYLLIYYAK